VIRNGFGQDPAAPRAGPIEIPPFSDATPGLGATLSGLSSPAVREADVFSELSQPGGEEKSELTGDIFSEPGSRAIFAEEVAKSMPTAGLTDLGDAGARGADVFSSGRKIRPPRAGGGVPLPPGPRPVIALSNEEAEQASAARRRKLMRRAPILMIVMLLLMGGAWAATYFLIPFRTRIQATLNYNNFSLLTQSEQRKFQHDQQENLLQESTRNTALRMLQNRYPGTPAGFLSNPDQYRNLINPETRWKDVTQEDTAGHFVIRYDGTDAENDKARVEAAALALFDSNSTLANSTRSLRQTIEKLQAQNTSKNNRMKELQADIDHARAVFDARPTKAQLDQLQADDKALEAAYTQAIAAQKSAQADVDQIKKQQEKDAAPANGVIDPVAADQDLKKLSADAEALNTKLAAARKERAELASKARATLDSAYDEFKKQVETSGDVTKNNPELAAYVKSAQDLQAAIADLTDNYTKHQQDEYAELNRFKNQVEAKIKDRKADQMANDPKLKELAESKEVKQRQFNAAKGSGLTAEADNLDKDLRLIDAAIKAQQEVIANDPVFNELITGLQKMIDDKQRSIDDERKRTDEKLASLKSQFAKSSPTVEKLPAEQKELAAAMQERLAQIDAARKQYAEAADASAADADTSIKRMNDELQQLQTNIELRKKQILATNNEASKKAADDALNAALAQKTQVLDEANKALTDARAKYDATHTTLLQKVAINEEASRTAEKLDQDTRERAALTLQLEQNNRDLDLKQQQFARAVEPIEPTAESVTLIGDANADHREQWLKTAGISSGGIFLLFAIWILMTLISASRESHHTHTPPIETLETTAAPKQNGKRVNGASETEEEPVVA
jgi:DNA repair exonuclease SbcCD ATPase subunit